MKNLFILFFISILCLNCEKKEQPIQLNTAKWLVGNWMCKTQSGTLTEHWNANSDSLYQATSTFIRNKDTLRYEQIKFMQNSSGLQLISDVIENKKSSTDSYIVNSISSDEINFKSTDNSYPETIHYKKKTDNKIEITIAGQINKKLRSEVFVLDRY